MRESFVERKTKETDIKLRLNLDGNGIYKVNTGIGFLNHLLESFSKHSFFDLEIEAKGDIDVSFHHTVEDCGIVLGQAFLKALKDKKGIKRFGHFIMPMDEALVMCAVDISGRPLFYYDDKNLRGKITDFDFELVWEFIKGFALESRSTIHLKVLEGKILHHVAECSIKCLAKALKEAVSIESEDIPSTKGSI